MAKIRKYLGVKGFQTLKNALVCFYLRQVRFI